MPAVKTKKSLLFHFKIISSTTTNLSTYMTCIRYDYGWGMTRFDGVRIQVEHNFSQVKKTSNFTFSITFICKCIVNYYKFSFAPSTSGAKLTISFKSFEMTSCGPCDLCIQDSGDTKIEQLIMYRLLLAHWLSESFWYNTKIVYTCTVIITLLCYQTL